MRLLVDLLGWTLDLTLAPTSDDTTERDHVGGSFEVAPALADDENLGVGYDERVGFRGKIKLETPATGLTVPGRGQPG